MSVSTIPKPQTYKFGWLFVLLVVFFNSRGVATATDFSPQEYLQLTWGLFLAVSAALRKPWGWYVLLVALPVQLVRVFYIAYDYSPAIFHSMVAMLVFGIVVVVHVLWFAYFYKRRAMFGAQGRWRWIERTFPAVVGPEPSHVVTRVVTICLALAVLLALLLILYQVLFPPAR